MEELSTFNALYKHEDMPTTYSIFVPDDHSFKALHPVELAYLKTRFGQHDKRNLLMNHACQPILYRKDLNKGGNVSSIEGELLRYDRDENSTLIEGANVTHPDIVARNGMSTLRPC